MNGKQFVMTSLLIAGILTGILSFSGDVFTQYGSGVVGSSEYSSLESVSNKTSTQRDQYVTSTENQTQRISRDIEENQFFLTSIWEGLQNTYTSLTIFQTAVVEFSQIAGGVVPAWFVATLMSILTVIVIWLFLKRR